MNRTERLLRVGYLPSQLPPPFRTGDLATHHATLYASWVGLQQKPKQGPLVPRAPESRPETFSVARAGYQRRITSLPNPIAQTYLSTHVAQHWGQIVKHFRQSRLSASHPRFLRLGARAANIPPMHPLYERKILAAAGYRYMLRTDISRFFPTIYTHSVPWAFHGKAAAKKNHSAAGKYFGNLLDLSLRQCQDQQTMGLLIGPDTSHVVAEAVATAVDLEFIKRLKGVPAGFRYVDDYYLFFSTLPQAEEALAVLMRALREFELDVNFEKTKTCSVIDITDDFWTHQLRSFDIANTGKKQLSDLHHFFELAKQLAAHNADESVMTYAIKRASSTLIRKDYWDQFESHMCHVGPAYPVTLQTVARVLSTYAGAGYPIGRNRLGRMVNSVIQDHAPLGHHSEVAWALWMCKDLELQLEGSSVDLVSEMHSSVCALLLLDLHATGKLPKAPKTSYWKQFQRTDALYGDLWLLSFEAGVRGWAGFTDAHIRSDARFHLLLNKAVHFYDQAAKLSPMFHAKPQELEKHKVASLVELVDLEDAWEMVDFEDDGEGYDGAVFAEDDEHHDADDDFEDSDEGLEDDEDDVDPDDKYF